MRKANSFKKVTSSWTDLITSINYLITKKLTNYKSNRQSMTKNALSFFAVVVLSFILSTITTNNILVTATSHSSNSVKQGAHKGKFCINVKFYLNDV